VVSSSSAFALGDYCFDLLCFQNTFNIILNNLHFKADFVFKIPRFILKRKTNVSDIQNELFHSILGLYNKLAEQILSASHLCVATYAGEVQVEKYVIKKSCVYIMS